MFGEMEAIDSLLQQLAYYKRHDPNQVEVSDFASLLVPTAGYVFPVMWIGIVLMHIRIRISIFMPIRIWIGIKTMPIHLRILPQVLQMLENLNFLIFLFTVIPVHNVFPFSSVAEVS
jgi:hypothetical protein